MKTRKKPSKLKQITKALSKGNVGDAIEVIAKPIAKVVGLDEDCEGCKGRKQALNFGDKVKRQGIKIDKEDWITLNNYFTQGSNATKDSHWRFSGKHEAFAIVDINNKYMPKYLTKKMLSCPKCVNNLMKRVKPLWENKNY